MAAKLFRKERGDYSKILYFQNRESFIIVCYLENNPGIYDSVEL